MKGCVQKKIRIRDGTRSIFLVSQRDHRLDSNEGHNINRPKDLKEQMIFFHIHYCNICSAAHKFYRKLVRLSPFGAF